MCVCVCWGAFLCVYLFVGHSAFVYVCVLMCVQPCMMRVCARVSVRVYL